MSLEQPSPQNEPLNALKDEAELDSLSSTQDFSHKQGLTDKQGQTDKQGLTEQYTAISLDDSPDGPKKSVSETAQTVVSGEPPLEIVSPLEAEEAGSPSDTKHEKPAGPIPPSGIQFSTGMMLGPFTINKFIGGGGMGRVYLGLDKSLDRKVALKVLQRQRAQDQFSVARFMNEARSAARLNHEHIAQVYFAGQQDDIPFIAFEFVEGTNIRTVVEKQGVFPLLQAITYLIQIAHALDHVALHGVIHRDVKPSNILITKGGRAKLIDMGLARLLKPTDPGDDLTASGVTLGTFDYISPEQARDPRNADIRSDIYSLGCTFFFMLTGRPPFHEGTVLQKLLQHQGDEPPDIRHFLPEAPPEVAHILQKMMAKDPRQRYQTPASLLKDLMDLATQLGLRPSAPGKTVWTMRSAPKRSVFLSNLPWISSLVLFFASLALMNWLWPPTTFTPRPIPPNVVVTPSSEKEPPTIPLLQEGRPLRFLEKSHSQTKKATSFTFPTSPRYGSALGVGLSNEMFALRAYTSNRESSASLSAAFPTKVAANSNLPNAPALLIVDPANLYHQEGVYSNLGEAIAAAGKDATIELRFDGNANMKIEPVSFVGKHLTIQAGKGFSPVLQFNPLDSSVVKEEARIFLFSINGGNLHFHAVAFEMEVSQNVFADKWSLFDMLGPSQLLLTDCSITIRNTKRGTQDYFHDRVSVFRIAPSTGSDSNLAGIVFSGATGLSGEDRRQTERLPGPRTTGSSGVVGTAVPFSRTVSGYQEESAGDKNDPPINQLTLANCIVRGETTVLSVEAKRPVRMEVKNAFFATDLPFVSLREVPGFLREKDQKVNISMQHVSLYCKSKLNRFVKKENMYPMSVKWLVKNSILRLNATPINEFFGFMKPEEAKPEELTAWESEMATYSEWDGELAFFQDVSSFAEIKASTSVTRPPQLSLDDWKTHWSSPPDVNIEVLQSSRYINRTVNRMVPRDMALSQRPDNPAAQKIPKPDDPLTKIDAGQIFESLPKL